MNVLVVDDDPTALKLISSVLMAGGHDVVCARNAEQALERLAEGLPDIIIADLVLPVMDGIALAKLLKALPETALIPIIATTAYVDRFQPRDQMRQLGFAALLPKPIDLLALSALVTTVRSQSSKLP